MLIEKKPGAMKVLSVRADSETFERIHSLAESHGVSPSDLLRGAMTALLSKAIEVKVGKKRDLKEQIIFTSSESALRLDCEKKLFHTREEFVECMRLRQRLHLLLLRNTHTLSDTQLENAESLYEDVRDCPYEPKPSSKSKQSTDTEQG